MESTSVVSEQLTKRAGLDFLWLELTNQCNLNCRHCYSDSSPYSIESDILGEEMYLRLLTDAHKIGCRQVQFIGGEPTLNKSLPLLIQKARTLEFDYIEVYTNLIKIDDALMRTFITCDVSIATSVYADKAEIHDTVTRHSGSYKKTLANIKRILDAELPLRISVISMKENAASINETIAMLRTMGVKNIGVDNVREFGRGEVNNAGEMSNLCGNCANSVLAIGPDGVVAPCIMSKQWAVGSVLDSSLKDIVFSDKLTWTRDKIAEATAQRDITASCGPDAICIPNCTPSYNCTPCSPNSSQPCNPNGFCQPSRR